MKKKQGFTLIELLVVIIVLSVLLLIAVPSINRIINESRSKTYRILEETMAKSSKNYISVNFGELPDTIGSYVQVDLEALQASGYIDDVYDLENSTSACTGYINITKIGVYDFSYDPCLICDNHRSDYCDADYGVSAKDTIILVEGGDASLPLSRSAAGSGYEGLVKDDESTGLDESVGFSSKYYYTGANPDNYLVYGNQCFRILNISQNGSVKLIYNDDGLYNGTCLTSLDQKDIGEYGAFNWDSENLDTWGNADIKDELGNWYDNLYDRARINYLASFETGDLNSNATLVLDIDDERDTNNTGSTGLINLTDYIKASSNISECTSVASDTNCEVNSFLDKNYSYWSINGDVSSKIGYINNSIIFDNANVSEYVRPILYLNSNTNLSGAGTISNPYKVIMNAFPSDGAYIAIHPRSTESLPDHYVDVTVLEQDPNQYYYMWNNSSVDPLYNDGGWTVFTGGTFHLESVSDGTWYLHIKATNGSGDISIKTSVPLSIVSP